MPSSGRALTTLLLAGSVAVASAASAQNTDDNAVASAEDAFGTSTSHETIGVYDEGNVRGFSPGSAGNYRIEGMYFDIQGGLGNRVIDGSTIRVGPAAQGYAFPAPTGIVDLQLKKAGDRLAVSPFVSFNSFGGIGYELDAQVPLAGKQLTMAAGIGLYSDRYATGTGSKGYNIGLVPRWHPAKGIEVLGFYSHQQHSEAQAQQLYVPTGPFLPPRMKRNRFPGPDWAVGSGSSDTMGLTGHALLGDWTLRAGLFRSASTGNLDYSNIVLIRPDTTTDRLIYANPGNHAASWSGELRASRRISDGPRQHLLTAALRGRSIAARYGGSDSQIIGSAPLDQTLQVPRPEFHFGPQTGDQTRQLSGALGYSLNWRGLGELTLGLQRTHYVKRVANPGVPEASGTTDVTLPSASVAIPLTHQLTAYGSYVRGLEDGGSAPGYAANPFAVLPAIRTRQVDAGLRWSPVKGTTLIAGYFRITKPFIDIDQANRYGVLGEQTHQGGEFSLTSDVTRQLRVVAGAVYLDPKVKAAPTIAEPIGQRPVNQTRLRARFNINWTLPAAPSWTLDAYMNHDDGVYANVDNSVFAPGATRVGVGLRYKFKLAGKPVTARVSLYNIFNTFMVYPVANNVYIYNASRNVAGWLAMDL